MKNYILAALISLVIGQYTAAESSLSRAIKIENFEKVAVLLTYSIYDQEDFEDALSVAQKMQQSYHRAGERNLGIIAWAGMITCFGGSCLQSVWENRFDRENFSLLTFSVGAAALLYGTKHLLAALYTPSKSENGLIDTKIKNIDEIIKKLEGALLTLRT